MRHLLQLQLSESFALYDELIGSFTSDHLRQKLPVPSNTIGLQLWCVIGARESWARAITNGAWRGFACSINDPSGLIDPGAMSNALKSSARAVHDAIAAAAADDARTDLMLRLLVHESQHQGQLLRYLLGLKMDVPAGWKKRFAL